MIAILMVGRDVDTLNTLLGPVLSIIVIDGFRPCCRRFQWIQISTGKLAFSQILKIMYFRLSTKMSVHGDRQTVSGQTVFGNSVLVSVPRL